RRIGIRPFRRSLDRARCRWTGAAPPAAPRRAAPWEGRAELGPSPVGRSHGPRRTPRGRCGRAWSDGVSWAGYGGEDGVDQGLWGHVVGQRAVGAHDAMAQYRVPQRLDVVRDHVGAAGL